MEQYPTLRSKRIVSVLMMQYAIKAVIIPRQSARAGQQKCYVERVWEMDNVPIKVTITHPVSLSQPCRTIPRNDRLRLPFRIRCLRLQSLI